MKRTLALLLWALLFAAGFVVPAAFIHSRTGLERAGLKAISLDRADITLKVTVGHLLNNPGEIILSVLLFLVLQACAWPLLYYAVRRNR